MALRPLTKKQFIGWLIVFTIGMTLWVSLPDSLWTIAIGIVTLGNLILITSNDRSLSLRTSEVLYICGGVLVFGALIFASKRWLSDDFGIPLAKAIRHPVSVAILWALAVCLIYRRTQSRVQK
jgi:hypothetical protein